MSLPEVAAPKTVRISPTRENIRPIGMRKSRFIEFSSAASRPGTAASEFLPENQVQGDDHNEQHHCERLRPPPPCEMPQLRLWSQRMHQSDKFRLGLGSSKEAHHDGYEEIRRKSPDCGPEVL